MPDFLKQIIKETGNEYASLVSEGVEAGDVDTFIDTGSYHFNALLSGSIHGGIPSNKITALAGESALTKQLIEDRGIDSERMIIMPVTTVQEFRTQSLTVLDKYIEQNEADRKPILMVLDSLGMLSTTKEVEDTADGKETRDMTRAQVLKAAFRVLTLKLGRAKVPMVITNHTYDVVGAYMPTKEMGGGSGLKYAASTIIYLSKKKDKEGTEVVGNIIHCKTQKSRLSKENMMVDVRLRYDSGLDKYYGLLDLATKYGIFKQVSTRIELPDGTKQYAKSIYSDPEKYFTDDILKQIDEAAKKEYSYGNTEI